MCRGKHKSHLTLNYQIFINPIQKTEESLTMFTV